MFLAVLTLLIVINLRQSRQEASARRRPGVPAEPAGEVLISLEDEELDQDAPEL